MTYVGGGRPEDDRHLAGPNARLRRLGGQETIDLGAMLVTVVASRRTTDGRYSLYRLDLGPRSGGAAPHYHRTFAESFHVLAGRVLLHDGADWVPAGEGDHLYVPEGAVHGFRNEAPEPAVLLMTSTPAAAREDYFDELRQVAAEGRRLTPAERDALYARHDQYMVPVTPATPPATP